MPFPGAALFYDSVLAISASVIECCQVILIIQWRVLDHLAVWPRLKIIVNVYIYSLQRYLILTVSKSLSK